MDVKHFLGLKISHVTFFRLTRLHTKENISFWPVEKSKICIEFGHKIDLFFPGKNYFILAVYQSRSMLSNPRGVNTEFNFSLVTFMGYKPRSIQRFFFKKKPGMSTQTFWLKLGFWDSGRTHDISLRSELRSTATLGVSCLFPGPQNDKSELGFWDSWSKINK